MGFKKSATGSNGREPSLHVFRKTSGKCWPALASDAQPSVKADDTTDVICKRGAVDWAAPTFE